LFAALSENDCRVRNAGDSCPDTGPAPSIDRALDLYEAARRS